MPKADDKEKNLHKDHRNRVKKRFLKEGLDAFEDHQILELLLFYAIPQKDTNDLAHALLNRYGSLHKVFEADPDDICKIKGMGEHASILVNMISQLARAYMKDSAKGKKLLGDTKSAGEFITSLFISRLYEALCVISLDNSCKLLHYEIVSEGSADETPYYPRRIVESALRHKAHKVILAHNHPSGMLFPSNQDINATREIKTALKNVDIELIDHFIVCGDRYLSMSNQGIFNSIDML